jgi:hypothetical protein
MKQQRLPLAPLVILDHAYGDRFDGIYPYPEIIGKIAADLVAAQIQRGERSVAERPNVTMVEGSWIDSKARK